MPTFVCWACTLVLNAFSMGPMCGESEILCCKAPSGGGKGPGCTLGCCTALPAHFAAHFGPLWAHFGPLWAQSGQRCHTQQVQKRVLATTSMACCMGLMLLALQAVPWAALHPLDHAWAASHEIVATLPTTCSPALANHVPKEAHHSTACLWAQQHFAMCGGWPWGLVVHAAWGSVGVVKVELWHFAHICVLGMHILNGGGHMHANVWGK